MNESLTVVDSTTMFMGTYLSLALFCYPSYLDANHRLLIMPALLALPPAIMYSRVRLGVHTPAQCIVGGILGATNAVFCTAMWQGWWGLGGKAGLAKSSWVTDADEYIGLAVELGKEWLKS
jgi:membrane-associated phospholipid phosphatase